MNPLTPEEARQLLGGYATGNLSEEQRNALFAAALEDQELFDELMAEEALRETLAMPGAKQRLVRALESREEEGLLAAAAAPLPARAMAQMRMSAPPDDTAEPKQPWWRAPWAWGAAAVAVVTIASIVVVPRVFESRQDVQVAQSSKPADPEVAKPEVSKEAAPPLPAPVPKSVAPVSKRDEEPKPQLRFEKPRSGPATPAVRDERPMIAAAPPPPAGAVGAVSGTEKKTTQPPELRSKDEEAVPKIQRAPEAPKPPARSAEIAETVPQAAAADALRRERQDAPAQAKAKEQAAGVRAPARAMSQANRITAAPAQQLLFSFRVTPNPFEPGATLRIETDRTGGPYFVVARKNADGTWSALAASGAAYLVPTTASSKAVELMLILSRTPVGDLNAIAQEAPVPLTRSGDWFVANDPSEGSARLIARTIVRAIQ
jgi:hypothetical protein